jgi:hypothetical protein
LGELITPEAYYSDGSKSVKQKDFIGNEKGVQE